MYIESHFGDGVNFIPLYRTPFARLFLRANHASAAAMRKLRTYNGRSSAIGIILIPFKLNFSYFRDYRARARYLDSLIKLKEFNPP